jgi:hypothetical protein
VIRGFQKLVEYLKAVCAGHLLVPGCSGPEALDDAVRHRAAEFAEGLVKA